MGSVTVRNVEDDVKKRLRMKAARHGVSMEEHLRRLIHKDAYEDDASGANRPGNFYDAIRALVDEHGGFDLELPPRGPMREPPRFD